MKIDKYKILVDIKQNQEKIGCNKCFWNIGSCGRISVNVNKKGHLNWMSFFIVKFKYNYWSRQRSADHPFIHAIHLCANLKLQYNIQTYSNNLKLQGHIFLNT